ncbi:MAG: ABC transporter permease [Bifidobacterium sp.]|nr:ABC transporter permease [Bifidobacterium sp.]MCH4175434.1 ABC transporter permease [Bifidobacterium sp.]
MSITALTSHGTTSQSTASRSDVTHVLPTIGKTRVTWSGLVSSEWIKMRTRVSTYWLGGIAVIMMIAMAIASAIQGSNSDVSADSVMVMATGGVVGAQFCAMLLGVFTITNEYRTGQIRSTFNAVPKRLQSLAAKTVVVAIASFVVTAVSIMVSFVIAHVLSGRGLVFDYFSADILRMFIGAPFYMAFIAVLSLMVGAILRKSAGAVSIVLLMFWALPGSMVILPPSISGIVAAFLPSTAGAVLYGSATGAGDQVFSAITPQSAFSLPVWGAFLVLVAYAALFAAIASAVTNRRDV